MRHTLTARRDDYSPGGRRARRAAPRPPEHVVRPAPPDQRPVADAAVEHGRQQLVVWAPRSVSISASSCSSSKSPAAGVGQARAPGRCACTSVGDARGEDQRCVSSWVQSRGLQLGLLAQLAPGRLDGRLVRRRRAARPAARRSSLPRGWRYCRRHSTRSSSSTASTITAPGCSSDEPRGTALLGVAGAAGCGPQRSATTQSSRCRSVSRRDRPGRRARSASGRSAGVVVMS